ncbi:MAG: tRNA lysidine(34) synthetase TilS [Phycisphaerales bacterium JB059]
MSPAPAQHPTDPPREAAERAIRRAWRRLTGGKGVRDPERGTLVACSGGSDSSALAWALASTPAPITIAHIVHDLRPRAEALADREGALALSRRLKLPFLEAEVQVRDRPGNVEANAREARYTALNELALEAGAPWIATAHHADDVLETMIMRLLRGSGPGGLGGPRPVLPRGVSGAGVGVVRPCLGLTREELVGVCRAHAWTWREDATNRDPSRVRGALRERVTPALRRLFPAGARRAAHAAELLRETQALAEDAACALREGASRSGDTLVWSRERLREAPRVVLGEMLRGLIRAEPARMEQIVRAIRDDSPEPRGFLLDGQTVSVRAREVRLESA